jgi:hypothetical protein
VPPTQTTVGTALPTGRNSPPQVGDIVVYLRERHSDPRDAGIEYVVGIRRTTGRLLVVGENHEGRPDVFAAPSSDFRVVRRATYVDAPAQGDLR